MSSKALERVNEMRLVVVKVHGCVSKQIQVSLRGELSVETLERKNRLEPFWRHAGPSAEDVLEVTR